MTFLAAFIGVDRYQDPGVRELGGARRDATALWALFADTIPDLSGRLLVDEDASTHAIRRAMEETLDAAGPDDVVFLSFSGHGSHDHRIVTHDTQLSDLANTTIPMSELSQRFKRSRAKAIICVLDCCFSGAAPARVLEDSPTTRDPGWPLPEVAGAGRVIISAADLNEVALESPHTRHGLLTKALMNALEETPSVSIPTAMDRIMQEVRTEAARMGHQQTPILLGHIEGGLVLPTLTRGERFNAAFPELRVLRLTGTIPELEALGLSPVILQAWSERFQNGLNPLQLKAVNDHGLLRGESLLVVAPTSSGKTFIGEMAAARAIAEGRKAVFLFPYKALVNEKFDQFSALYGEALGLRVVRCTGDYQDDTSAFTRGRYDLAVLTYEMFLNLAVASPGVLNQLGILVVDEAQFIADPNRGIVVELLLTLLLAARERGIDPQLLALSAVIGGLNGFDRWLGGGSLVTTERPVPLTECVLDRTGTLQYVAEDGSAKIEPFLPRPMIVQRRDDPSSQDVIVPLVQKLLRENPNERIIVFRNARGPAQGCAAYLAHDLGLPPARAVLAQLTDHDPSSTSLHLRTCLAGGTAFHNSNLTREERAIVERTFREPNGPIVVLAATTTVAAGINTPASTVILAEQEFVGEDGRPFTVAEYKNMAGRAGRYGFNEMGRSIILADTSHAREQLFGKYVLGAPEPITSSFDPAALETWVLRLLAQVARVERASIVTLLANTYGGYLAGRRDPGWRARTERQLEDLVAEMLRLGLLEEERGWVNLTLLGRACARSSLSFLSAMRLVGFIRAHSDLSAELLMCLVQALPELDAVGAPLQKKGQRDTGWPRELARTLGHGIAQLLGRHVPDAHAHLRRCKRALVLSDWTSGIPLDAIEKRFTTNPYYAAMDYGSIRRIVDATRFHLGSAYAIASVILLDKAPLPDAIDTLFKQLEVGIPAGLVQLLELPVVLLRGEYLALGAAGLSSPDGVRSARREQLIEILGENRTRELSRLNRS